MSRSRSLALLLLVILAGLASRLAGRGLPRLISKDLGDVLWAAMFFFLVRLAWPRMRLLRAAVLALAISATTEFLKLYHASWIDALRTRPIPRFLLGGHFQWGNLAAYAIGVTAASLLVLRHGPSVRRAPLRTPEA